MRNVLRFFFRSPEINPWIVVGALLLAGVLEGIGIASLVPLLGLATGDQESDSALLRTVRETVDRLGVSLDVGVLGVFIVLVLLAKSRRASRSAASSPRSAARWSASARRISTPPCCSPRRSRPSRTS
ncbi:MAG: hypothetical protein MUF70_17260 [Myxococcota bacterium]|nr:hypothetical protein [Myxococcota bacterium]